MVTETAFVDKHGIQVQTPDWPQGPVKVFKDLGNYVPVLTEDQPGSIKLLVVLPQLDPELVHIVFSGVSKEAQNTRQQVLSPTQPFENPVPIYYWEEDGTPNVRQEPFDNFRVLVLNRKTGRFTLLEVGLVWRKSIMGFLRTTQILYEGCLTSFGTRGSVSVVPADLKSARPGLHFLTQWSEIDAALPRIIKDQNITVSKDVQPAIWDPGVPPVKQDGTDLFVPIFNSWVAEQGGAIDQEGTEFFQKTGDSPDTDHFLFLPASAIQGNDPIKVIPLGTWLRGKIGRKQNPRHKYRPVLSCRPVE